MGAEFQFETMKKSWRWMVVMVAQQLNVLNATTVYLKMPTMIKFMLSTFYHNKRKMGGGSKLFIGNILKLQKRQDENKRVEKTHHT